MKRIIDQRNFYRTQVSTQKISFIAGALNSIGLYYKDVLGTFSSLIDPKNQHSTFMTGQELIEIYKRISSIALPGIGLRLGSKVSSGHYGMYGCTLLCREKLEDSLDFSIRYHPLVTRTTRLFLEPMANGNKIFGCDDILEEPELKLFNLEFQMAIDLTLIREVIGDSQFSPVKVHFSHARQHHLNLYVDFFKCPIEFNSEFTGLELKKEQLSQPLPKQNPLAIPILLKTCDEEIAKILSTNSILQQAYGWICENVHGDLTLEKLAGHMCMTSRTLRRRLSENNASFNTICTEVKCRFAKRYLSESEISINDIAFSLGFSDDASFRKAFKSWTQMTPSQYRNYCDKKIR